jgi:hypothetical protein
MRHFAGVDAGTFLQGFRFGSAIVQVFGECPMQCLQREQPLALGEAVVGFCGHASSFSRSLIQRRGFVSSPTPQKISALGVYPIRALQNEGGAERRRLAGLHGSV